MKTLRISECDYIKANRRASRQAEIENHTRPVRLGGTHKSKKAYDRRRDKAEMKKALPYLFYIASTTVVETFWKLIFCRFACAAI